MLGASGELIFTTEDRERGEVEHEVSTALLKGRVEDRRWHVTKDGTRLFIDGVLIRLDDESGTVRGFVKVGQDATVQYQAEEALQRARDELEIRVKARTADLAATNQALQREIVERKQVEAERAMLLERIITTQEDERQRIARELHDSLGQFLTALNLRLSALQGITANEGTVKAGITDLRQVAQRIDSELDRLTMELRPPALDDLGLEQALRGYVKEWGATSGIPVDVLVHGLIEPRLPSTVETTVYRIVQEALTNILKHAHATQVSIILEQRQELLRVIVEDDGQGFDMEEVSGNRSGGRQVGLLGMAERANLAGGTLTIESEPGSGTTIYLHIPLSGKGQDTLTEAKA